MSTFPSPIDDTAVILAAGLGTRMKSALPKALHRLAGRSMLRHLIASAETVFSRIVVVVGPETDAVAREAAPHQAVVQQDRLGTGHAARTAAAAFGEGDVAILTADNPLITPATLRRLRDVRRESGAVLVVLTMRPPDPGRYGRVIQHNGRVQRIVEWNDASAVERGETLCNAGTYLAAAADLRRWLAAIGNTNAAGEYYLTDIVALAAREGAVIAMEAPWQELLGINSRAELAEAEAALQARLRGEAMAAGVTMADPGSVFLCADTVLEPDVTLGPSVVFGPGVTVRRGAEIRAFSHLEGCVIGPGAIVGPFARLRPGADLAEGVHVGNFVEVKAARLEAGVKANHLTYIGDATIGARTNVGAGTITCNYDGHAKHRTTIGADVFVGSDSVLVAPVTIGDGALITAGSVITENVEPGAMAFGRARQSAKAGLATIYHRLRRKEKA
jgi:bifunctional UDP-N-acetylglucosamine pyrophosphorylase/glucosamine-1-phosphate N-acetyltransferase